MKTNSKQMDFGGNDARDYDPQIDDLENSCKE